MKAFSQPCSRCAAHRRETTVSIFSSVEEIWKAVCWLGSSDIGQKTPGNPCVLRQSMPIWVSTGVPAMTMIGFISIAVSFSTRFYKRGRV